MVEGGFNLKHNIKQVSVQSLNMYSVKSITGDAEINIDFRKKLIVNVKNGIYGLVVFYMVKDIIVEGYKRFRVLKDFFNNPLSVYTEDELWDMISIDVLNLLKKTSEEHNISKFEEVFKVWIKKASETMSDNPISSNIFNFELLRETLDGYNLSEWSNNFNKFCELRKIYLKELDISDYTVVHIDVENVDNIFEYHNILNGKVEV